MTASNKAPVAEQALRLDLPAISLGETDGHELAVHSEERKIRREIEAVVAAGGGKDDVECHLVGLVPAVDAGLEEAVRAHGKGVGLFTVGARDSPGLGSEGLAKEDAKVTDATTADY